jgi:hypothetical protein
LKPATEEQRLARSEDRPQEDENEEEIRISSRDHPGLVYVKTATITSYSGSIRTDGFSVKAITETAETAADRSISTPTVSWQKEIAWSIKGFNQSAWKSEISIAGLEIASIQKGSIQTRYFIKQANASVCCP